MNHQLSAPRLLAISASGTPTSSCRAFFGGPLPVYTPRRWSSGMVYGACAAQDRNIASVRPYVMYVSVVFFAALRKELAIRSVMPVVLRPAPPRFARICLCISCVEGMGICEAPASLGDGAGAGGGASAVIFAVTVGAVVRIFGGGISTSAGCGPRGLGCSCLRGELEASDRYRV